MGMMAGNGKTRADINMTPMIDVLLVLIIIFMVITPTTSRGLNTLVPQTSTAPAPAVPQHDIVVTVLAGGQVLLNQESLDLAALEQRLHKLFWEGASDVIFIRADKALDFGNVVRVIDLARGSGVRRVALMTT